MRDRRLADLAGNDAYELIGVADTATRAEIRHAYRQAMHRAHPDHGGSEEQAKRINLALELLMEDRQSYDAYRRRRARLAPEGAGAESRPPDSATPETPETPDDGTPDDGTRAAETPDGGADDGYFTDPDDVDPWAAADDGVGAPGRGADAPGAAEHPVRDLGEPGPDDGLYRPFRTPGGTPHAEPRVLGRLLNIPTVLSLVLVGLAVVAAIANTGNDSSARYVTRSSVPFATSTGYVPPLSGSGITGLSGAGSTGGLSEPMASYFAGQRSELGLDLDPGLDLRLMLMHFCTVDGAGKLRCSGRNEDGQLGVGDRDQHDGKKLVDGGQRWRAVTTGARHSCAIRQDRTLWCWGANNRGQLGTGTGPKSVTSPRPVSGGGRWRSVVAVTDVTCAVRTTGTLWCWGDARRKAPHPPVSRVPERYGRGITWTKVQVRQAGLCAERPRHPDTCWSV